MVYLGILVLVAVAGLLRLWLQHRRERRNVQDLEALQGSLRRLAERPPVSVAAGPRRAGAPGAGARTAELRAARPGRSTPVDRARREAARRRIEQRRAARRRVG